jgi:hypothetical protein
MPIRYVFKDKPLVIKNAATADPQLIGEALTEIKDQLPDGECNSRAVTEVITNDPTNYLRRHLEWDDAICGVRYRQDQVRELMSCINLVETDKRGRERRQLPAFISLNEGDGRNYRTVREVMDSASLSAIALKQVEREMEAMESRLAQFGEICDAIRHARELIAERRRRYDEDGGHPRHG